MKFGHAFQQRLKKDGFPPEWIESAISYGQLKKCIKRVQTELANLGLDRQTLGQLLRHVENYNAEAESGGDVDEKPFEYILQAPEEQPEQENAPFTAPRTPFHPKLLFIVDDATGEPLSASLAPETKAKLHQLAVLKGLSDIRVSEVSNLDDIAAKPNTSNSSKTFSIDDSSTISSERETGSRSIRMIEVPLTSDTEFFETLSNELSGIASLQAREEKKLHQMVSELSKTITKLTEPDRSSNRKDIEKWRAVFQAYVEANIFFATGELDHGAHDVAKAEANLLKFSQVIAEKGLATDFKNKEGLSALTQFININREMLQMLRFQEINYTAMVKILKKFDKRTALGVRAEFPKRFEFPMFSENTAKSVCTQLSKDILSTVPQLDDYLCPLCFEIKWRPVKLRCSHIFCIRCLIRMQKDEQDHCPLCRSKVVMEACAENLDDDLAAYLKKWFPKEVKAKQKMNEYLAGIDEYGEAYKAKCVVM
ncbi:RING-14 protein-like protein [Lepidopterella palustris CBS 459.81]|uniref:RING-14 protein-like protein n=1 Tax=Lepidopterella palustris CBS 459.81 TaxID=1314670 RepID=A0A8E2EI52_9PEZI|nr:RING-14 protein-like protein [Lepidopterella palustris CBS 459.81]